MATRSKPPIRRQRVTWESVSYWLHPPQVEILEDTFTRTPDPCPGCGAPGVWTADPDYALVCTHCEHLSYVGAEIALDEHGTPIRDEQGALVDEPRWIPEVVPAHDFWATIIRQLQLAEAAAGAGKRGSPQRRGRR